MLKRRDAQAIFLLTASAFGSAGVAFAVQATLARTLLASEYGDFASSLAALTIIAPAVGFGLPAFWLKVYGTEGWSAVRWMEASSRFVRISSLFCIAVASLWASFSVNSPLTTQLMFFMLPIVLTQGAIEMASTRYQLEERFGLVAAWQAIQHVARFGVVLVCASFHESVQTVALGFGCVGATIAVGAWWSLSPLRHGNARLVGHGEANCALSEVERARRPTAFQLFSEASPFGVASLLYFAYAQSGLILVAHLAGQRNAGLYSVAITIFSAIYLFPSVIFQKLLIPRFHRWAASNDPRLHLYFRSGSCWMFGSGVAVGLVAALLAPEIVPRIFGPRYVEAVPIVMIMAICAPFRFVTTSASSVMTTRDLICIRNRCAALALVVSVGLGCVITPLWGPQGAAIASVVGEIVWAVSSLWCGVRYVSGPKQMRKTLQPSQALCDQERQFVSLNRAFVSVIIPCYNCGATVERAVASVYSQTCRPTELILIDDCSTDDTLERLEQLKRSYGSNWIQVLRQPGNLGPGAARNVGWTVATQPYIAFLDSDDTWHGKKIEVQYGWMTRHQDVAITGHPVAQATNGQPNLRCPAVAADPKRVSRWRVLFSNRFTPSTVIVRANIHARFDETKRYAEDYYMLLSAVLLENASCYLFSDALSDVYKPQFGAKTGLSSRLWKMQKGEQDNYRVFKKIGAIGFVEWIAFSSLSFAKYLRRCILSGRFA